METLRRYALRTVEACGRNRRHANRQGRAAAHCHRPARAPLPHTLALVGMIAFGTAVCAVAAPVPLGDPTIYSRIRFYSNPTFTSYLSPDPVAELSSTGSIKAETDRGEEIGLALAAPFGLYGGEAAFLGGARTYGGNVIYGTTAEVWYEQRYRVATAQDSLTANMFGMDLVASDGGSGGPLPNRAMFLAYMWVTTDDPDGPNAGTADGRHLSNSDSYARIVSLVDGVYDNWRVVPPMCQPPVLPHLPGLLAHRHAERRPRADQDRRRVGRSGRACAAGRLRVHADPMAAPGGQGADWRVVRGGALLRPDQGRPRDYRQRGCGGARGPHVLAPGDGLVSLRRPGSLKATSPQAVAEPAPGSPPARRRSVRLHIATTQGVYASVKRRVHITITLTSGKPISFKTK